MRIRKRKRNRIGIVALVVMTALEVSCISKCDAASSSSYDIPSKFTSAVVQPRVRIRISELYSDKRGKNASPVLATAVNREVYSFRILNVNAENLNSSIYSMRVLKEFRDRIRSAGIDDKGNMEDSSKYLAFEILGKNFTDNIEKVEFMNRRTGKRITVRKESLRSGNGEPLKSTIQFENSERITGYLSPSVLDRMIQFPKEKTEAFSMDSIDPESSQGIYDISLYFANGHCEYAEDAPRLILSDRPTVIDTFPSPHAKNVDAGVLREKESEKRKEPSQQKKLQEYYAEIVMEDLAESFRLSEGAENAVQIHERGKSDDGLNDPKKPLVLERYIKQGVNYVRLYVPLKAQPEDGKEYEWEIAPSKLGYYSFAKKEGSEDFLNHGYKSDFSVNRTPKILFQYEGSVPENYDASYPLLLEGEKGATFLKGLTKVYFIDEKGKRWEPDRVIVSEEEEKERVWVYLPSVHKLPKGLYRIVFTNGGGYKQELSMNGFSVVGLTGEKPNEETKLKLSSPDGQVIQERRVSRDHLILSIPAQVYDLDIDERLGKLPRNVKISLPVGNGVSVVKLKSGYGDLNLEDLHPFFPTETKLSMQFGQPGDVKTSELRKLLRGKGIRSEFVELSDTNFVFSGGNLTLKYKGEGSQDLVIMRYDEELFSFEPLNSRIDEESRTVSAGIRQNGIYVVVNHRR